VQTVVAWRLAELPSMDQSELVQFLDPDLGGAGAGEEEELEEAGVQVAVVVECSKEDQITLRKVLEDFGDIQVGETSGSPWVVFTTKKRTI
jgi:hypothetical protein